MSGAVLIPNAGTLGVKTAPEDSKSGGNGFFGGLLYNLFGDFQKTLRHFNTQFFGNLHINDNIGFHVADDGMIFRAVSAA